MPRPAINFDVYIRRIPEHNGALPPESAQPVRHYAKSANEAWNLLGYAEKNLKGDGVYAACAERHVRTLRVMVMLSLIEAFERFLKETAASCVDQIGQIVLDDRLNVFTVKGDAFAAHFSAASLGKCLCEPVPWCDCDAANERFRRILADPYDKGSFYVFPKGTQQPAGLLGKYELVSILWQLRHAIVHNRGIMTASDAHKLRVLCRSPLTGPVRLDPTSADVWYVKVFLDDVVETVNAAVATRLGELLTRLHKRDDTLFEPLEKAQELANLFQAMFTVRAQTANPA